MKQRRRGLTLVELSAVLAVVVMLIAMLAPILSQATESDNRVACSANMQVSATAMKIYANENEEWWPTPAFDEGAWRVNRIFAIPAYYCPQAPRECT